MFSFLGRVGGIGFWVVFAIAVYFGVSMGGVIGEVLGRQVVEYFWPGETSRRCSAVPSPHAAARDPATVLAQRQEVAHA